MGFYAALALTHSWRRHRWARMESDAAIDFSINGEGDHLIGFFAIMLFFHHFWLFGTEMNLVYGRNIFYGFLE